MRCFKLAIFWTFLVLIIFGCKKKLPSEPEERESGSTKVVFLDHEFPFLVNFCPSINALIHKEKLAKWDIIILPPDNLQRYHKDWFDQIRNLNPKLKILLFVSCMEIPTSAATPGQPWSWLHSRIKDEWWLRDPNGNHIVFWPGAWMLNVSSKCPVVEEETWSTCLARYLSEEHLATELWDGVFLDCCWDGVSQIGKEVDANDDGQKDNADRLDSWWYLGMQRLVNELRERNPGILIVGNGDGMYKGMNGLLSEDYPHDGDFEFIKNVLNRAREPKLAMINCCGVQTDTQKVRYGLCTSLMLDHAYFAYDAGVYSHAETWWYSEYNIVFGKAMENYIVIGGTDTCYFDDFTLGWENYQSVGGHSILENGKVKGFNDDSTQEWTNFLDSKYYFEPNTIYHLSFDFRIIQPAYKFYCEIIRFSSSGKEWLKVENFCSGSGTVSTEFTTNSATNWFVSFGVQGVGVVLIDNVLVRKKSQEIWKREFENVIVLVNPTDQPTEITINNQTVVLQGMDGKIVLK